VWYDHGIGKGGNLIDFGILYHDCSVRELLQKLNGDSNLQQAPQQLAVRPEKKDTTEDASRIKILSESDIKSPALINYLHTREIPLEVAQEHCRQVDFELYGKRITALGFPNRSGGYELRNTNFKGSSSPKDVSFIDNGRDSVTVFEGFFSFLSHRSIDPTAEKHMTNYLVLNSLAFLEKSRDLMERHAGVRLYLDRDRAGIAGTEKAIRWGPKYLDFSEHYKDHKDLNKWLTDNVVQPSQQLRQGIRR